MLNSVYLKREKKTTENNTVQCDRHAHKLYKKKYTFSSNLITFFRFSRISVEMWSIIIIVVGHSHYILDDPLLNSYAFYALVHLLTFVLATMSIVSLETRDSKIHMLSDSVDTVDDHRV